MPNQDYVRVMARYNRWQNDNLLTAAQGLDAAERDRDRGAFFGSITRTFSHLLWADRTWMSRFDGGEAPGGGIPASTGLITDWDQFLDERRAVDARLIAWADSVPQDWFQGDLHWYSGALGRDMVAPKVRVAIHIFNHQTHHRGQIHAMLTAAGAHPGATDLAFMPEGAA